jgi:hypothetical protein
VEVVSEFVISARASEPEQDTVSPETAALLLRREFTDKAHARFMKHALIAGGAVIVVLGIALAVFLRTGAGSSGAIVIVETKPAATEPHSSLPPAGQAKPLPPPDTAVKPPEPAPPVSHEPKVEPKTEPRTEPAAEPLDTKGPIDEVERYIRMAVNAKDGHMKVNALIFRPKDPRLRTEYKDRPVPKDAIAIMHAAFMGLDDPADVETGPDPDPATDEVEARMLTDPDLVGTGLWVDGAAENMKFIVFLEPCKYDMDGIRKKFGYPGKTLSRGKIQLHFYGRMLIIEMKGGKIQGVARKVTKEK